ncbi:hypothetical protein B1400_0278 [Bifidobacterium italicum]|uniref:Uncharacterized protein n=1 Tax=Bifidobacterium italicum TaxID=1960968 RepID=A0A2A2ELK1_9BIFI|nr:hypothetical protein [Bifidobacterium italicum]PAU70084.1 hypothetical protein B1400_0278 [Bifidobacterium italicum]
MKKKCPIASNESILRDEIDVLWSCGAERDKEVGGLVVTDQRIILCKKVVRMFRKDKIEYISILVSDASKVNIVRYPRRRLLGESQRGEIQIIASGQVYDIAFIDDEEFRVVTNNIYHMITGKYDDIVEAPQTFGDKIVAAVGGATGLFFESISSQATVSDKKIERNEVDGSVGSRDGVASKRNAAPSAEGRSTQRRGSRPRSASHGSNAAAIEREDSSEVTGARAGGARRDAVKSDRHTDRDAAGSRRRRADEARSANRVVVQCQTCGAKCAGVSGRTVRCEYCDNPVQLR